WHVADAWTSNAYGRREPAGRLVQRMSFTGELVAATLVQPADDAPLISLRVANDDGATLLMIERAGGARDVVRVGEDSSSLVYNCEVFNHPALKAELEAQGHVYHTRCDTETVLKLYEIDGREAPKRLRGMFAFAIWDARTRSLLLARHRFGVKPLYYHLAAHGTLVFGSEIKALLESGILRASLREEGLPDYLAN